MALNKSQLVDAIAAGSGLTKVDSEKALNATVAAIKSELAGGGSVTLIGFGTFAISDRKARVGKNPQTGAEINIAAKKVARFKAGKALSELVNPKVEEKPTKKAAKKK